MVIVESYPIAVVMCVVTMLCWGSWANTQKLASKEWRFQLFYWDCAIGVFLLSLILAFTMGSSGSGGRCFCTDLVQADGKWLGSAFLGGVIFNLSNILLVAAIDIAGLAVAFPVGVGLALVLGVITTYIAKPEGNVPMLAAGVAGSWYAWQYRASGQTTAGPGPDPGDDTANDLSDNPPAVAGADAEFFLRNNAVNAAVLASLKPGGSGARQEVRLNKTVALRGTVVTPDKVIEDGIVVIEYADQELGGRMGSRSVGTISKVAEYSSGAVPAGATVVDFSGSCIYPGFVDMHNHVHYNAFDLWQPTFDLFPNRDVWPKDPRYSDWKKLNFYFGRDGRNMTVEVTKFGEIRGLLFGETTMQGYNGDLPGFYGLTRGIENKSNLFGVDHINQTVMNVSMWYKGSRAEATRERLSSGFASGKVKRYIIHLCEGIDDRIREEFVQLKQFNLIREEIIGIHSTALRGSDWDDVAAARMKVVWSPLSNLILYNQTTDIKGALERGVPFRNISFAPDWGPSGTPGMLYEAKIVAR